MTFVLSTINKRKYCNVNDFHNDFYGLPLLLRKFLPAIESHTGAFNGQTISMPAITIICNSPRNNTAKPQNDAITIKSVALSLTFTDVHIQLCYLHMTKHLQSIKQK